jgi:hypothetical protein
MTWSYCTLKQASVVGEDVREHRRLKDSTFVVVNSARPQFPNKLMHSRWRSSQHRQRSLKHVSCLTHKTECCTEPSDWYSDGACVQSQPFPTRLAIRTNARCAHLLSCRALRVLFDWLPSCCKFAFCTDCPACFSWSDGTRACKINLWTLIGADKNRVGVNPSQSRLIKDWFLRNVTT